MPDEQTTTQTPEGLAPEQGASQGAEQNGQPPVQSQNGESSQVETGSKAQVRDEVRPFERVAGRKLDKLEKGFQTILSTLEELKKPAPSPSAIPTNEDYINDPLGVINKLLDEREQKLKGEIPKTLEQQAREQETQRSRQEALKMIETNDSIKKDPEGRDRITDILTDDNYGLEKIASDYPLEAARMALEIYNVKYGKKAQAGIPTKAQMGTTATAARPGNTPSVKDEASELQKQVLANPELLNDPEFAKKIQALKDKRKAGLSI